MHCGERKKEKITKISSAIFIATIVVLSSFTLFPMTTAYGIVTIRINEIMYNPAGADNGHEWIEIYNKASYAINITGWRLFEQNVNHTLTLTNGSMEIPAGGFAVIADNYLNFLNDYPSYSGTLIDSSFKLLNSGEYLAIKNDAFVIIHDVTYVPQDGANGTGMTLENKADDIWEVSIVNGGTPGAPNSKWNPPIAPADPIPEDNSKNISVNPTLSVIVTDPDNDSMHVYFYNAFDDSLIDSIENVQNGSRAEVNWSDLQYNTTYEWYVVANDSSFENKSDIWTFTTMIKNSPPNKPTDPLPENDAINISLNATISVNVTDPDNDTIDVSFYNASDDSLIGLITSVQNDSRVEINWTNLQYNITYEWYVVANDSIFQNRSDTWAFTTMLQNRPPDKPTSPIPENNSINVNLSPIISVLVIDPDNNTMDVYFYNASDDSLIDSIENVENKGRAEVVWPNLEYNTTYRWYATADDGELLNQSDTWNFTTMINYAPNKPTNPFPEDNSINISLNTTISVIVTDQNEGLLNVFFYDNETNKELGNVSNVVSGNRVNISLTNLSLEKKYEWYVIVNDGLLQNTSDVWSFTTILDPNRPPKICLVKPLRYDNDRWWCYIRNRRTFRHQTIFIIGYIDLEVNVTDNCGVEKVRFYIDNEFKGNGTKVGENTYQWTWNERIYFGHTIKVVAIDTHGNRREYSITVFIINFKILSWGKK